MHKRKIVVLFLVVFIFSLYFETNVFANELENITLENDSKLLTNDDFLDISDITDNSDEDTNYSIQNYAQSYIDMLDDDIFLMFDFVSSNSTQIIKNNYGGNLIYSNDQYKALDNDSIIKIIPQEYFTTIGEHIYFGLQYGFYIKTFIENDLAYYDGQLDDVYVSDVFLIDYNCQLPNYSTDSNIFFSIKPLMSARYYTLDYLNYYEEVKLQSSLRFFPVNIIIDSSFTENMITIANTGVVVPNFNMKDLCFISSINNKENLNQQDGGYNCYDDNGLFIREVKMSYDTYGIKIDDINVLTNGHKIYDVQIKDEFVPFEETFSYMIGQIPLVEEAVLFYNYYVGYTEDTTSDINVIEKNIDYSQGYYALKSLQCDYYNCLIKDVCLGVENIDSVLKTLDTYNCNQLEFKIYYSSSYSEIYPPSTNNIGLSFKLYDKNGTTTEEIDIIGMIEYNIFSDMEFSNNNSELLPSVNASIYSFIIDVDYSGSYSIAGFKFVNLITDNYDNHLSVHAIYEINDKNIDEDNEISIIDNKFFLNNEKKYLMIVRSDISWVLNVCLIVNSIPNINILGSDFAEFNYAVNTDGNYLFKLNKSNLDVEMTYSSGIVINNVCTLNNSNNTNEMFELQRGKIYKIKIYNTSLGNKIGVSLNIETNVLLCNEQKILETYLNDDSTCTVIYTAQNNEKITISTSGLLDTEYIDVVVEGNHSYSYEADYIDEENDVYDPNASLTVELEAGESILITINEYSGISGKLFIHVIVQTL